MQSPTAPIYPEEAIFLVGINVCCRRLRNTHGTHKFIKGANKSRDMYGHGLLLVLAISVLMAQGSKALQ